MRVRAKKAASRKGETPKVPAQGFTFPAPIAGWVLDQNLATPTPASATRLDNWVCTTTGIRARGGKTRHATLPAAVTSLFSYSSGGTQTLFGATSTAVYDITSPADPLVAPAAEFSGQASGIYSTIQFGTAGGDFLVIANGTNDVRNYDGAAWTTPAITGATSSTLETVWSFASRLFFTQTGTLSAWYLPVDSIAGAAVEFSLKGIFTKGGTLVFGAKWSLDAGDGLDDKCVFMTSEGEVAVYEGTNPASASDWRRAGLYQMPKPMGRNAFIQAGGDLLIATEIGLIPLSAAIQRDIAAIEGAAVSRPITPYWQERAQEIGATEWEIIKAPNANIMVVSQPDTLSPGCLVVGLQTGAWSRFTGWDTQCMEYFVDTGYFGSTDFGVYSMEVGGSDDGALYTCIYIGQFEQLGAQGQQKTILQARPIYIQSGPTAPRLTMQVDFSSDVTGPPSSPVNGGGAVWDTAVWDTDIWDGEAATTLSSAWVAIGKTGYVAAPEIQATFGITTAPRLELVSIDVQLAAGAIVA